jgi:hypothetical protein
MKPSRTWGGAVGAAFFLAIAQIGFAADGLPAIEAFQQLRETLVSDKKRADWTAFLENAERLRVFLNGSPASVLEVARAQLELGRTGEALNEARHFVAMGQIHPILDSPLFQPVRSAIDSHLSRNVSALSIAKPVMQLSDSGLLPEDIDYDSRSRRFFVTSILEHNIVALDAAGHGKFFADSPDHWPMMALKIDTARRRLWATEVALDGFPGVAPSDSGRSVVLEYQLDQGTLLARYIGPPRSNLGDMVLTRSGDPIVSDGNGGGIYRLRSGALQRIDHGDFISPQTIAICPGDPHAFVPDYVRGIAEFDLETGTTTWLPMENRHALDGIDGLYCHGNSLIAVQNGTSPVRIVSFTLDPSKATILKETAIERATSTLGAPTHGVLVGGTFFYIANSGWDAIDDHGAPKSSARLTPAIIMRAAAK